MGKTIAEIMKDLGFEPIGDETPAGSIARWLNDATAATQRIIVAALESDLGKGLIKLAREMEAARARAKEYAETPEGQAKLAAFKAKMEALQANLAAMSDPPVAYAPTEPEVREVHHVHYVMVPARSDDDDPSSKN